MCRLCGGVSAPMQKVKIMRSLKICLHPLQFIHDGTTARHDPNIQRLCGDVDDFVGEKGGLSAREDHYKARSACLNKFAKVYGYLPLHTSKIVMTSVSYHL